MNKLLQKLSLGLPLMLLAACAPPMPDSQNGGQATDAAMDPAPASDPADGGSIESVRAALRTSVPDLQPEHIRKSPLPGIYEIQVGMNFGYVTGDGRYLIAGDLTDLKTGHEISEDRRRTARVAMVDRVDRDGFIEFAPENQPAKYTVTVFTDVDCGYCRMLHRQIKDYNALGIAVRYVFFPRTGLDTPSYYKAEEVWCSADRKTALTQAKAGAQIGGDKSCANPIREHLQAATDLGLRGTPSIVLPDGELIPGYRAPAALLAILQKSDAPGAAG